MEYTTIGSINEYESRNINPLRTPDTFFEMYSVPAFDKGHPEYLRGSEIASSKLSVQKGDVLLCKINPRINRVWVVADESENTNIASSEWIVVRSSVYNPDYLAWYFRTSGFRQLMSSEVTGIGGSLTRAQPKRVAEYPVPVIAREEQDEIVEILNRVKCIIDMRNRQMQKFDTLIKSRFVEMFGGLRDGKFEIKTLSQIVLNDKNSIKRGPFGGALKKDDFVEDGYLVYEQRHAIHNDFEYEKYYVTKEKYEEMIGFKVVSGDLIISCSGVTLGRIAEVPEGAKEGIINQALLKLSLNQSVMMNTFFINQFRGEEIQEILFGFSRGSGIPNMPSMSEVKAVKFICPPLELQKQYCAFVHQVDKSKIVVQKSLDKIQVLFDSLMQKYFG